MEKPVKNTTVGIFDMDMSPSYSREALIPDNEMNDFPEIAIIDEEKAGWVFFKNGDDERMKAIMSFAED